MKILFLTFHGFNPANGISKKIHYQVRAFRENGHEAHLCHLSEKDGYKRRMVDDEVIADYGNGIKGKIYKRTEYSSIVRYVIRENIDFIYIRSDHNANPFTINMLRQLKKSNVKMVMEIPTYPYDQEYATLRMKLDLWVDKLFRKKLASYLDYIVTFSDYKKIFGVQTLQISNGINFEDIPLKQHQPNAGRELHLIGVAEIHYWHGFDRLIKGLANYYSSNPEYKVYFHIIGDFFGQREHDEIVPLIRQHHLAPYVLLHGKQHGENLDNLFEQCNMGIGSLGRHRSGITNIKTLKNREYSARGISFIYSETDEDFDHQPYILKAPADETPIDIQRLIEFYQQMTLSPEEIRASVKKLSWKYQIEKVLSNIRKDLI